MNNFVDINLIPINIVLYQVDSQGNFIFSDFNLMAQETDKISKETLIGRNVVEVFPEIKEMGLLSVFQKVYASGISEVHETAFYKDERISGWRKNTITKINDTTIMAAYENISVIKKLEDKIFQDKKTLEDAQKLAKLGTWSFDIQKNILIWDKETYKIFDIINHGAIAKIEDFYDAIYPDDVKAVNLAYNRHLEDKTPYAITHRLKTHLGTIKYVEEKCTTSFDADGIPIVSSGTIHDITTIKEQEIALKNKDILLLHQSRLAQMGELISMIAHQWRQPLASIASLVINMQIKKSLGSFDMTTHDGREDFMLFYDASLEDIEKMTQHLSSIIDDFRNFYAPRTEANKVTLKSVITKALGIINVSIIDHNIEVETSYTSNRVLHLYDNEIMHVILNLLKNSVDNFKITKVLEPKIMIQTHENGFTLCDNGGGIPQEMISKVFDPYFSTKKANNGSGLGLYMSKTIVEEHHNGSLEVKNKNNGAYFTITLNEAIVKSSP